MKVLQVNKYWRARGGNERYVFELSRLLEQRGHEIIPFAMQDEVSEHSHYSSLFVTPMEFTDPYRLPVWRRLTTSARVIYSKEAQRKIALLADLVSPDVAHIHNIYHQLSPSVLPPLKRRGIGTVMTVHDYKLFCPAISAFKAGGVCDSCQPLHYYNCVSGKCVHGSAPYSLLCAVEMMVHDLLKAYTDKVDHLIAPSGFMAAKLEGRGVAREKISIIPNFVDVEQWQPAAEDNGAGDFVLYYGRLAQEKGVETLIRAVAELPQVPLKILGAGMMEGRIRSLAKLLGADNIEFLGYQTETAVKRLLHDCRFVCAPSLWHENAPMSLLEAFASGKGAVASRIGGLPELVREGETGLLVEPGSVEDLQRAIDELWCRPDLSRSLGLAARRLVEAELSPEAHYNKVLNVYGRVKRS